MGRFLQIILLILLCVSNVNADTSKNIGVILPLSGPLAEYGQAISNGIKLAQSEDSKLSECHFVFEDSKYDSTTAVTVYNKILQTDNVKLIYNFGGPTSAAIAPVAEKALFPTMLWTTDSTATKGKPHVIRFANSGDEFGKVLQTHLLGKKIHNLAVVKTENQYLNSILSGLEHALSPDQTITLIDSFQPSDTDFRSSVTKLKGKHYDSVGVFLLTGQVGLFYRQMKQQGVVIPTFGTDFFESTTEIASAQGGLEGAVYVNNAISSQFEEHYKAKFGNDIQLTFAGNAYEFAKLSCEVVSKSSSNDETLKLLTSSEARNGVLGKFSYSATTDGDHYYKFPIIVKQIEKGSFKEIP